MRGLALVLLASFAVSASTAQVLRTGFERDVNRYRWTAVAAVEATAGRWDMALDNRFVSDAYEQYDRRLRFRDENILRLRAGRLLTPRLSLHMRGHMDWYGLSRAFSQELYGSLRASVLPAVFLEPVVGVAADRRPGALQPDGTLPERLDVGPAFGFLLGARRQKEGGYQLSVDGTAHWQQISPRRQRAVRLGGEARRQFGQTQIGAQLQVTSRRRDTYQSASFLNRGTARSETIEATVSDTLNAGLSITAPLYGGLGFMAQADLRANRRQIRTYSAPEDALFFDTDFDRRALDAVFGVIYDTRSVSAQLLMETSVASEQRRLTNSPSLPPAEAAQKTNLLRQADYDEGILGVRGLVRARLWPRLAVTFSGSSRIVRHDTPQANPDDRDEVYHQGELGVLWRVSDYVEADIRVFGSWYHAVYLKAQRSAENNVQRSLRLRPGIRWTPGQRTTVRLASEVRATYTVDDFVLEGRRPKDQSAREMRMEAELDQTLWQDALLRVSGSYADLRLGRLLWDSFAEIPFDTLRTYNAWVHVEMGGRLRADIGWRIYLRSDYDRAVTVRYPRVGPDGQVVYDDEGRALTAAISRPGRRWIRQMGPTAALYWERRPSSLRLDVWANMQRVYHRLYGDLPELSASRIREAARTGTRRLIPMITLTVVWNV